MISNTNWNSRIDAETFPILDRELVAETVRILNAEEEKEFAWKQFIAGWQQAKLGSVNAESIFKQLWKEQE